MGGKALKKSYVERKELTEYLDIKNDVLNKLSKYYKCSGIRELPDKTNFGDLDVLYITDPKYEIIKIINELFSPTEIVPNGDVVSFNYRDFQIDFIKCTENNYDCSNYYYSYGDFGAILGKISKYYGISFGQNGLWMELYEGTVFKDKPLDIRKTLGKIKLTTNPKEISGFFGLDYSLWNNGFSTNLEVINYICSAKIFRKDIFCSMNYCHRQRKEFRPFYKTFIEFIGVDAITNASVSKGEVNENLQGYLIDTFNKHHEVETILKELEVTNNRKQKFNGKIFMDLGISEKKLGKYITEFKNTRADFNNYLDSNSKEQIHDDIVSFISDY